MIPQPGAVYYIGPACGVPWNVRPIYFRLIHVDPGTTWEGMAFLNGYELDRDTGDAVERRTVYVIVAGLRAVPIDPDPRPRNKYVRTQRPTNTGPIVPAQRRPAAVRSTR